MSRLGPAIAACAGLALAALVLTTPRSLGAAAATGALSQGPIAVCTSEDGSGGACADGSGLDGAFAAAVTPDGANVYVASSGSDAIAIFARDAKTGKVAENGSISDPLLNGATSVLVDSDGAYVLVNGYESSANLAYVRDPKTGALTYLGCISETGSGGACSDVVGINHPYASVYGPDERFLYVTGLYSNAVATFSLSDDGPPAQAPSPHGCVSDDGSGGDCVDGVALLAPMGIAFSKDGRSAYVAASGSNAVAVFSRNKVTGELSQLPGTAACVSETGSGGDCTDGAGLLGPSAVAVSPDGKQVYVGSYTSDAVAVFARDKATGALTQLAGTDACVSDTGSGGACADGRGLDGPAWLAFSPKGDVLFVAAYDGDGIAVLARNPATGALAQLPGTQGCVSDSGGDGCAAGKALDGIGGLALDRKGAFLYSAADTSDALGVWRYDAKARQLSPVADCVSSDGSAGCAVSASLAGATRIAVSKDGRFAYAVSPAADAVTVLARDRTTGDLRVLPGTDGCVSNDGSGGRCVDGRALDEPTDVVVAPSGKAVYVVSRTSDAVAVFDRDAKTGLIVQRAGAAGCIAPTAAEGCRTGPSTLDGAEDLAIDPKGAFVYAASPLANGLASLGLGKDGGLDGNWAGISSAGLFAGVNRLAVAPDGKLLYATVPGLSAVRMLPADFSTVPGAVGSVGNPSAIAISKDGASVYVTAAADDKVQVFARDRKTGLLTEAGCISDDGSGGCADGTALVAPTDVIVAGSTVYVASTSGDTVAALARNSRTGELVDVAGPGGCVAATAGPCSEVRGIDGAAGLAAVPDGSALLVAAETSGGVFPLRIEGR